MIYLTNENINELDLINSGYYGNIYLINNEAYKVFKDYLVETDKRIRFYNIIKK